MPMIPPRDRLARRQLTREVLQMQVCRKQEEVVSTAEQEALKEKVDSERDKTATPSTSMGYSLASSVDRGRGRP